MPLYSFTNKTTGQSEDIFFSYKEVPKIGEEWMDETGEIWIRATHLPQAAPNGLKPIDPHSSKQFVNKTGAMKGTVGDLWTASEELSAKRAEKNGGIDPVREKHFDQFEKSRRGTTHPARLAERQKKAQKKLEKALAGLGLANKTV